MYLNYWQGAADLAQVVEHLPSICNILDSGNKMKYKQHQPESNAPVAPLTTVLPASLQVALTLPLASSASPSCLAAFLCPPPLVLPASLSSPPPGRPP